MSKLNPIVKIVAAVALLIGTISSNVCLATPESEQEEQERVNTRFREADQITPSEREENERVQTRIRESEQDVTPSEIEESERVQARLREAEGN